MVVGSHYEPIAQALLARGWQRHDDPSLLQWEFCFTMVRQGLRDRTGQATTLPVGAGALLTCDATA